MLAEFLAASPHGIRVITQTLHRYALVQASLQDLEEERWWWTLPTVVLLRLIDADAFRAFLTGQLIDVRLLDKVFQRDWARPLRGTRVANLMEAAVAVMQPTGLRNQKSDVIRAAEEASATQGSEPNLFSESIMYWYDSLVNSGTPRWARTLLPEVARRVETFTMAERGGRK